MFFKKEKKKRVNAMFLSANKEDEVFMKSLHNYATEELSEKVQPFFRRVTNFFFFEWIFAIQRNLEHDLVVYMSEYEFRKYTVVNKNKFFTRFYFDCLAKMHFINSYSYLRKHNIDVIYVKDDISIPHIACILAAHNLKIDVKILYDGYRKEMLFVDANATRFRNSLPKNVDFYQNLQLEPHEINNNSENTILVLLQKDDSLEVMLDSPFVKNQKYLLATVSNLSKVHPNYKFIIFNSDVEFHNTENVIFSQDDFADLIPNAKAVITINSTQAMYAFEYDKPVVLFGNAFYAMNGLTIPIASEQEISDIISKIEEFEFDSSLAHKFIAFVQHYYAVKCTNFIEPTKEDARTILLATLHFQG